MKFLNNARTLTLLLLVLAPAVLLAGQPSAPSPQADPNSISNAPLNPVSVEVWNPDVRSSNITSLSLFPVGAQFTARINVTNAGPMSGFDVSLNYNITNGPNVLQAQNTGNELTGGLFDPGNPPAGCGVLVARDNIDVPAGRINIAAFFTGGCSVNGTGTLFTITFQVTGTGATSIDIIRTTALGKLASTLIGPTPTFLVLPFTPRDAYFRNKPGIPPVAFFTHIPSDPVSNETVTFDASQSYDPKNSTLPGKGISKYSWAFGDVSFNNTGDGVNPSHVFTYFYNVPAVGSFTVKLVVWDYVDQLPAEFVQVVVIAPGITTLVSANWSGYAIEGASGSVTDVTGSWVVPGIVGPCPTYETHAGEWIGMDGLFSTTVEQTGTDSACINGVPTYYAWYEFYPKPSFAITRIQVHPGDVISAEVRFAHQGFKISITDVTTGVSFSKSSRVTGADRSSAEWIAEAPSGANGEFPLSNFGTTTFGQDNTGVAGTCAATVGGVSGPLGSFGTSVVYIKMAKFQTTLARPSLLSKDLTSFSIVWVHQ